MDSSRYLESLAAEFALLRAAVTAAGPEGLAAPVPTCPSWYSSSPPRPACRWWADGSLGANSGRKDITR
jgi:hypothetical protein